MSVVGKKLPKGTRVRVIAGNYFGECGTVLNNDFEVREPRFANSLIAIQFDTHHKGMHSCDNQGEYGWCYYKDACNLDLVPMNIGTIDITFDDMIFN